MKARGVDKHVKSILFKVDGRISVAVPVDAIERGDTKLVDSAVANAELVDVSEYAGNVVLAEYLAKRVSLYVFSGESGVCDLTIAEWAGSEEEFLQSILSSGDGPHVKSIMEKAPYKITRRELDVYKLRFRSFARFGETVIEAK